MIAGSVRNSSPQPCAEFWHGGGRVQWFTPLLIEAARPCRHAPGDQ
jgi:hypothetical protein